LCFDFISLAANVAGHYMAKGKNVLITSSSSAALDVIRNKIAGEDGVFLNGDPMQKLIMSWGSQREVYTRFNAAKHVLKERANDHQESSEDRDEEMTRSKALTETMKGIETQFREGSLVVGKKLNEMAQFFDDIQDRTLIDMVNLITDVCQEHTDLQSILKDTPQRLAETIFKERTEKEFALVVSNDLVRAFNNEETRKHLVGWFKIASKSEGSTSFLRSQVISLREGSENRVDRSVEGGILGDEGGGRAAGADCSDKENEFMTGLQRAGLRIWAQSISKVIRGQIDIEQVVPKRWERSFVHLICKHFLVSLKAKVPCASMDDERIMRRKEAEDTRQVLLKEIVTKETQRHAIERYKSMDHKILEEFASKLQELCLGPKRGGARGKDKVQRRVQALLEDGKLLKALPIWIMPTDRVSEILPSRMDLFDLVILEEASQSDCQAIPALMRGQKLVIIGDNQQVNPRQSTDSYRQMIEKNLTKPGEENLPKRTIENLLPGASVFDLFAINFPGNTNISLREHFRCGSTCMC